MTALKLIRPDDAELAAEQVLAGNIAKGCAPIADKQAEDYLIGVTLWGGLRRSTRDILPTGEMFESRFSGMTWDCILEASERVEKVDMVLVAGMMRDRRRENEADELATRVRGRYRQLMDQVPVPTEGALVELAHSIRSAWIRRRAARELITLEAMAYDRTVKLPDLLARAREKMGELYDEVSAGNTKDDRTALIQELVAATRARPVDCMTGLPSLDDWMLGLHPKQTTLIGALTSVGKSVLGMQVALHVAKTTGKGVYYVSLETSARGLAERAAAHLGRANTRWVSMAQRNQITPYEFRKAQEGASQFFGMNWHTRQKMNATAEDIYLEAKSVAARFARDGVKMGLVVVDHLGLVAASRGQLGANKREVLARVSQALRTIAVELDCHVIGLAQLNRSAHDGDKLPTKHQFKDSSDLEQGADNVILIHRPDLPGGKQSDEATIILDKNRMAGIRGSFKARAEMWCATFTEAES